MMLPSFCFAFPAASYAYLSILKSLIKPKLLAVLLVGGVESNVVLPSNQFMIPCKFKLPCWIMWWLVTTTCSQWSSLAPLHPCTLISKSCKHSLNFLCFSTIAWELDHVTTLRNLIWSAASAVVHFTFDLSRSQLCCCCSFPLTSKWFPLPLYHTCWIYSFRLSFWYTQDKYIYGNVQAISLHILLCKVQ
jgi:hypothetical protein